MKVHDLQEHPEGGRFREVFRSAVTITTIDGRSRSALTHIYFSLQLGEVSRFHRVDSDEIWNFYRGQGLVLYMWDGSASPPRRTTLSPAADTFCHVVPAGTWQAAEPIGGTVLVGCSVAPGFEFDDFTLMEPSSDAARTLLTAAPELERFVID
jgi:hypothetical protein